MITTAVRRFSTSGVVRAAPHQKPAQGGPYGQVTRKRGTKGSCKTYLEYVNNKQLKAKGTSLSGLPEFVVPFKSTAVAQYADASVQKLAHLGAFKKYQMNESFNGYYTLPRSELNSVISKLELDQASSKNKFYVDGEAGIGKTTFLAQLQCYLLSQKSLILALPRCKDIVDGTYDYQFNESLKVYEQSRLNKRVLNRFSRANKDLLRQIPLSKDYTYNTVKIPASSTLYDLAKIGVSSKVPNSFYGAVFQDVVAELQKQSKFSVFVTVDNFNELLEFPISQYRDTNNAPIAVRNFQVPRFVFDLLSNKVVFQKGGLVLSSTSLCKESSTLKVLLGKKPFSIFDKEFDIDFANSVSKEEDSFELKALQVVELSKLSKQELAALVDFYYSNGLILDKLQPKDEGESLDSEKLSNQMYILSGGNPKELLRACNLFY